MTPAVEILTYAEQHGIQLSVTGNKLKVKGNMTPDFLEAAKQHKPDLMLMVKIRQACLGLAITPDQFLALTTEEDRRLIAEGMIDLETLQAYAASYANGIHSGRIVFHPTTGKLLRHN
jgi:hypothetical protein